MEHQEILKELFGNWSGERNPAINRLPQAGSDRLYYRISSDTKSAIGVFSTDRFENEAFLYFTIHFTNKGLPVPQMLAQDLDSGCYLLSDLGDLSLFDHLELKRKGEEIDEETKTLYRKAIEQLPLFQIKAAFGIDFSKCYPTSVFDERSMKWDLNYFKYYFLRLNKIQFNETRLEDDFESLVHYLAKADNSFFMYRDFQSRNIMIYNHEPWFIDYQGGRRGPLQYDLASILFQVKANLPFDFREELLTHYIDIISKFKDIDKSKFREFYYGFVLLRLLQVLGAYGFRGYYERRAHFLQSIPFAIHNLRWLLENCTFLPEMPELIAALKNVVQLPIENPILNKLPQLAIEINSFSFKNAPPIDYSGNGGGYVFDCRSLPNPGRYEAYKHLSGMDSEVIQFLENENAVGEFYSHAKSLVDISVKEYVRRGFTNLQINFGCTGGQHRSVFMAQKLAAYLSSTYNTQITIIHREINNWKRK